MRIGVLAIQGDYDAHRRRLEELGAKVVMVRMAEDLEALDGMVIPGGESSTLLKFLERDGFLEKLKDFVAAKPTFGTCAGVILLASEVENPSQESLRAMDITVRRNAYGRQNESDIRRVKSDLGSEPLESVFIRAPKISRVGSGVKVLAELDGSPILVREGNTMAATFHPELSPDTRVHQLFLDIVKETSK